MVSDVIRVIRKADGAGHRLVGVMIDITDQKRTEEALAYRAAHDTLTGLLNREQLDADLARVHDRPEPWALLFLDLNGFKDINDGLGHSVGDEVLRIDREAAIGRDPTGRHRRAVRRRRVLRPGLRRRGGHCRHHRPQAAGSGRGTRPCGGPHASTGGHGRDRVRRARRDAGDAAATGRRGDVQRQEPRTGVAVYEPWMRKAALLRLNDTVE